MATDNTAPLRRDPVRSRQILERIPAGRWGEPEDLAGAVVFLVLAAPALRHRARARRRRRLAGAISGSGEARHVTRRPNRDRRRHRVVRGRRRHPPEGCRRRCTPSSTRSPTGGVRALEVTMTVPGRDRAHRARSRRPCPPGSSSGPGPFSTRRPRDWPSWPVRATSSGPSSGRR